MQAESLPSPLLARELVYFLQHLEINAVPAAVSDIAKWCLLDALGCALFGYPQGALDRIAFDRARNVGVAASLRSIAAKNGYEYWSRVIKQAGLRAE